MKKNNLYIAFIFLPVISGLYSNSVYANTYYVNSISSFISAQTSAITGDEIVWRNGTYPDISISISKNGITVRSETLGGVIFNGNSMCKITGSQIVFSGFQYVGGDIGTNNEVLLISGNHNKAVYINFLRISAHKYITVTAGSQYNEITYCNIENKPAAASTGCTVQISTSPTVPGYHKIRYCSFQNFPGDGGDYGNEPIRIGLGAEAANNSRTIIEYCYFNNTGLGDSETISVKCCENVIRFCTFDYNPKGMLVFRIGNRNVAYGNFFIHGSGGIRCKEANDIYCYNNYFETSGAAGYAEAVKFDYVSPNLKNINFIHNTFIDCGEIDLGGQGPEAAVFANNIFRKTSGAVFTNPNGQTSWAGNIYSGDLGISISSGMKNANPLCVLNSDGYYGLSASSPAIDASSPDYPSILDIADLDDDPAIMYDISGQNRPADRSLKDVGCDEYTTGEIKNRPLKLSDVGPSYLISTGVTDEKKTTEEFRMSQNYPNPFNPATVISYMIPSAGRVKLAIYSIEGKVVDVPFDKYQSPGSYNYTWNPSLVHGKKLASGLYIARLSFGNNLRSVKLLYLK